MRKQKGIGLLELMLSLAIIAILLVMATRYYTITSRSQKVNEAVSEVIAIQGAIANWKRDRPDYRDLKGLQTLKDIGVLTRQTRDGKNPWGGELSVSSDNPTQAIIMLRNIPAWACRNLEDKLKPNSSCASPFTTFTFTINNTTENE